MEIYITTTAWLKLKYYISECEREISGFGKVRFIEESEILEDKEEKEYNSLGYQVYNKNSFFEEKRSVLQIYDIEILPQTVSEAHATIDQSTLAQFLTEKIRKNEKVEDYRVWWHSHATMEAFFSATDTNTIAGSTEFPYLVSIVGNHANSFQTRLDIFKPFRMTFEDITLKVEHDDNEELRAQCKKEIAKKVKQQRIFYPSFSKKKKKDKDKDFYDENNLLTFRGW
jgi:hypothetical protein